MPGSVDSGPGGQTDAQPDAATATSLEVTHVPAHSAQPGEADLVLEGDTVIELETHTINGTAVPDGIGFDKVLHEGQEHEEILLSVLRVRSLTIGPGATVRVTGSLPLVVIAGDTIIVDGVIDVAAHANVSGPGGQSEDKGPGAGDDGDHQEGGLEDSGGGGAGYATTGGAGGAAECQDPTSCNTDKSEDGGTAYGDAEITVLQGGSGGGPGSLECAVDAATVRAAGAGGGAIQLSAGRAIVIGESGGVHAGGGGGGGGGVCATAPMAMGSGAGGGSGGTIYLEAPTITLEGILAANGGAGGGGAGLSAEVAVVMGQDGEDGKLARAAAAGGARGGNPGDTSGAGGTGGAGGEAPRPGYGVTPLQGNGAGGGGGAAGRIVTAAGSMTGSGASSPEAVHVSY